MEKIREMREIVKKELEHIPRGVKGSPQNELRAIYWIVRMNSLGKRPRFRTREECLQYAIKRIRKNYPNFVPIYDSSFFKMKINNNLDEE